MLASGDQFPPADGRKNDVLLHARQQGSACAERQPFSNRASVILHDAIAAAVNSRLLHQPTTSGCPFSNTGPLNRLP